MDVGIVGLGKIGSIVAYRLKKFGHHLLGYDPDPRAQAHAKRMGITVIDNLMQMPERVRVTWLMVHADKVDGIIEQLTPSMNAGDIIIDGGDSDYKDTLRRSEQLHETELELLDCGTAGSVESKEIGFSLTIGGPERAYQSVKELFEAVAMPDGYALVGPSGAGHYCKMVHNEIKDGLINAYIQGLQTIKQGEYKDLNLAQITDVWLHGAPISSPILDVMQRLLKEDEALEEQAPKLSALLEHHFGGLVDSVN